MGEFSILTIKLLFLFLPGIIYRLLYERWLVRPKREFNYFIIYSFIAGVTFYSIYWGIIKVFFKSNKDIFFIEDLLNINNVSLHYKEILYTILISVIAAYIISWWKNHCVSKKILKVLPFIEKIIDKFKPSKVEQTIGVWDCVFDGLDDNESWIVVHDRKEKIKYYGWLEKYSENVKENELFLTDVQVLNDDDSVIKKIPAVYIAQKNDDIVIEFKSYNHEE